MSMVPVPRTWRGGDLTMLDQSILPIDPWSRKNFSKGTFTTKKPEHLDSETDETERIQKLEGLVDKMVPKELRMAGFIWP